MQETMLESLIEKLEKIEYKLMKIKTEGILTGCFLSRERCRSLTNMVNILRSLVNKTTLNKDHEDDIALCYNEKDNGTEEPTYPNFSRSEEFMEDVKNVLQTIPLSNNDIHIYLSNFLELLGDLVFSICEINNCQMKLASGIKVKNLVVIKNLYSTIWEVLSTLFYPNSFTNNNAEKIRRRHTKETSTETDKIVSDLVNAVESCLKEMSKVKLDIEHYIKSNIIEMQFNKPDVETKLKSDVTEDKVKYNETPKDSEHQDGKFVNNSDVFSQRFQHHGSKQQSTLYNMPPKQAESQENYVSSCLFPPNLVGWDNHYDCKFVEDSYSNFFNAPIIYPPDVLFFDPPTVVIQSQLEPTRNHSLPKIYSVDSIHGNPTVETNRDFNNSDDDKEKSEVIPPLDNSNITENLIDKSLFENTDDDLFSENQDSKLSEEEYVQLKDKISSLFNMLRTNQVNDQDDIFDMNPMMAIKKDLPNSHQIKAKRGDTKVKKKKHLKDKNMSGNMKSQLQNENKEKQRLEVRRNKNKKSCIQNITKKERNKDLFKQQRLYMEYPMKWAPNQSEVIYDRKSVIELFKSNPKQCFHAESVPTQESSFCLWPVAAEYIYVSQGQGTDSCSVSSGSPISLGKSFEKSFYSLHMNKKYEQNQLYDGDLIVLDHTGTLKNRRNSTYSLCNESNVTYDEHEIIENNVKNVCSQTCVIMPDIRNGQVISFNNSIVPIDYGGQGAQQQTYAVHYADCGESIMVNKKYKKEKIDFFNFNSYDNSQNWDSFISIMTSKFGPNTHINERRMFRKVVKNLAADSTHDNNLFGNVHTLTSSGGPFRLFDINGYPLTDGAGNVLKDPYGKSVVQLDSTGFPKDSIKVFDAAGNSPKDVNFDPTQKPQTNCIVVKLTDNFKRPLHLFDKYGRPLTDSNGKLLVNIHGRPLLRFDNFGRPNTDYRGGPLYTDNGFRWSYKMESFSKEQISNETLTTQKVKLQDESPTLDTSFSSDLTNKKHKSCEDNRNLECKKLDNFAYADSTNSEIWKHVENVLQHHSKERTKNKTQENISDTNTVVNSVTVKQNPKVKENLSSIIYHNNGVKECTYYYGRDEFKKKEPPTELTDHKVNENMTDSSWKPFLKNNINCEGKGDFLNNNVNENVPLHFYKNVLVKKNGTSKCCISTKFPQEQLDHYKPNIILEHNSACKDPQLLIHEDVLKRTRLMDMSICRSAGVCNNVPSIFTFQNHEYLNNLCNRILKNKVESRAKLKDISTKINEFNSVFNGKKDNLTDTALSDFTSSYVSKYTAEIPLYTDSPAVSVKSHTNDQQIIKILEDIDSKFKKNDRLKLSSTKRDFKGQLDIQTVFENKKKDKASFLKVNRNKDQRYEEYQKEVFKSSGTSEETDTYIDVVNNGSNQYQINVKERMRTGFNPFEKDHLMHIDSNNYITNDTDYPERENDVVKQNNNIPEKQHTSQPIEHTTGVYHGEYCRHFKNEKGKIKDSPFRFPSEERMETTVVTNNEVEYVSGKNWLGQNQNKTNQQYYEKGTHQEFVIDHRHPPAKHEHYYPKLVKKPQRNYRDCNLVSFLGTPVKYVLNKLDTKFSSRQQNNGKKHKHLKAIYEPYDNEKKVKALYHSSRERKKYVTSTEANTDGKISKKHSKQRKKLLAFKSKSYSEIQDSKIKNMSYSGSQDTSDKYSPDSSSQYNKCSSDTVVMSSHKHTNPQRRNRKHEAKKPKNEQYSFETHYVHTSNTTEPHYHRRNETHPKTYKKHTSKSPKNKTKTVKLFKKSGYSSKQKRER